MSIPKIPVELVAPIYNPKTFGDRDQVRRIFKTLRDEYPVAIAEVPGYDPHWIITRFEDVREITRRDDIFLNAQRSKTLASLVAERMMREYSGGKPHIFQTLVHMDEPMHKDYRAVTANMFMPQEIAKLTDTVSKTAKKWVARMLEMGPEFDFAEEIAFQYPLEVVCNMIGIPEPDHQMHLRLTQWMFTYADPDLCRPGADPSDPEEIIRTWDLAYNEWRDYFMELVGDRRKNPRDDMASVVANGEVYGEPMEERAMISYLIIAASAGHDSTAATTAHSMWQLAKNPEILPQLKADPALIKSFVEESIRWASPVQQFTRSAAEDYPFHDQVIKKGDMVYLSFVGANFDERNIDNPDVFDPTRWPNRHLGFGYGSHICLGQHLARLEMVKFWQELIPHLESVEFTGEPVMAESEFVCGPKSVPVRVKFSNKKAA
ncbi:MAG: cytochrome P450 [Zhongshania sp.]|uniref:cytochrome P450 n=1 Tax=Zhongshania sp. TaxID=1971902 RepID=UPI00261A4D75|nr:cytochrome P450 [Zhongshania sp.]MDF1693165.1 cytochrome P450 [Zhongshania sp.]